MKRKRILYLCQVPWGWIKQRPQFLAEELAKDFDVDVYTQRPLRRRKNFQSTPNTGSKHLQLHSFTYINFYKIPIFRYLNLTWVNRWLLQNSIPNLECYDYIWMGSVNLAPLIERRTTEAMRIYDCMDDMAEFPDVIRNKSLQRAILQNEKHILQHYDRIICSSEYLKHKILERAGVNRPVLVANNAVEINQAISDTLPADVQNLLDRMQTLSKPLVYIGTISGWFHFEMMFHVLNRHPDLNLVLIGPADVEIPSHAQLHVFGPVRRDYIFHFMTHAYALVMPFIVNELIRSVNPVKAYEYIYTAKPTLLPRYSETEKFADYAYLYNNEDEFCTILNTMEDHSKNEDYVHRCRTFALSNTWADRGRVIRDYIRN